MEPKVTFDLPYFPGFYETELEFANIVNIALLLDTSDLSPGNSYLKPESSDYSGWWDHVDYTAYMRWVGEQYNDFIVNTLKEKYPVLENLKFESIWSPREYNFQTDHVRSSLTEKEVISLINSCHSVLKSGDFSDWLKETWCSRDGFASFIKTNVNEFVDWLESQDERYVGILVQYLFFMVAKENLSKPSFYRNDNVGDYVYNEFIYPIIECGYEAEQFIDDAAWATVPEEEEVV